ncbi:MAG: crossover junction endodeoxyribonuclease RuvC [Oligoflexia bacterium]|nr:crossover junction endodeoxyribonuclease RuvC [Oligoflexia bacterium]
MKVLGIDPGSRKVGYALLEMQKGEITHINSGVLNVANENSFLIRIKVIHQFFKTFVANNNPDEIAIESLIYVKDPTALIKLAQARGAIISAFVSEYENKIFEYTPNTIKMFTTGYGHAKKISIERYLNIKLGAIKYFSHDQSDACAVSLCHLSHVINGEKRDEKIKESEVMNSSFFGGNSGSRRSKSSIADSLKHLNLSVK